MDNPLQSALQKMGGNFLVAAFTPSVAFILATYVAFLPIFQDLFSYKPPNSFTAIEGGVLLLASTILGFTVYTIEIYVYKAFEGYVFILGQKNRLRNLLLKKHRLRFKRAIIKKQILEKRLESINHKLLSLIKNPVFGNLYNKRLSRLFSQHEQLSKLKYDLISDLDHNYPPSESYVMPTRFGNILRSAEMYSSRYGIDAVALWSKLVSSMPDSNGLMEKINEANNQCQFLLNGAFLGTVFSLLCAIAASLKGALWWSSKLSDINDGKLALIYIALMIFSASIAYFFYEASLFNVEKFGEMIRTTYDLHRFDLLEALHMELPQTLADEKKTWLKLSYFFTGNFDYRENEFLKAEETIDFNYSHPPK